MCLIPNTFMHAWVNALDITPVKCHSIVLHSYLYHTHNWFKQLCSLNMYTGQSLWHCLYIFFIHSYRLFLYSASLSPLLLRGAPDTARILCRSFMVKRYRQLRMKDLPKVHTWWLERDLNPRLFG